MIVREFSISYYSEVTADLVLRDDCTLSATHPRVSIDDWFHFSDASVTEDPFVVSGDSVETILAEMADALYPGAAVILEQKDEIKNPKERFFNDFFIAFAIGGENIPLMEEHFDREDNLAGGELLKFV